MGQENKKEKFAEPIRMDLSKLQLKSPSGFYFYGLLIIKWVHNWLWVSHLIIQLVRFIKRVHKGNKIRVSEKEEIIFLFGRGLAENPIQMWIEFSAN